eukprot:422627_1
MSVGICSFCDSALWITTPGVYGPITKSHIYCNKCGKAISLGNIMYHCNKYNCQYDLCAACINSYHSGGIKRLNCCQIQNLSKLMRFYNKSQDSDGIEDEFFHNIDISSILNDFLHVLNLCSKHDHNFEIIADYFGYCDAQKCNKLKRNHRNRNNTELNDKANTVRLQILDKIHCYFAHSFDIGYRLTVQERKCININHSKDDTLSLLNKEMMLTDIRQLFEPKSKQTQNGKKYIQFGLDNTQSYNFGIPFNYGHKYEYPLLPNATSVEAVYTSLKEELIQNKILKLTLVQFTNEYEKAMLHHASYHCKCNYYEISLDVILTLMIYCNYTELQYQFSK